MTSKIKVDNIENQCGGAVVTKCGGTTTISGTVVKSNTLQASDAGNIISQSGTAITLGASGDSINLASGATQSGFGRTGTVDWDTTPKTATVTAVNGTGYFVNTTAGAITVNLPAGSAGNIVSLADYAGTWQTNNVTVTPNGTDKIGSVNVSAVLNTEGQSVTFVFVDSTQGWVNTMDSTSNVRGSSNLTASVTGACNTLVTAPCCANIKIATFTGPGSFIVSGTSLVTAENTVGYMVIAGGGGGGYGTTGGGGAGGFREGRNVPIDNFTASPLVANAPVNAVTVTAQSYPITTGGGGAGATGTSVRGTNGANSIFSTITSTGGGGGGSDGSPCGSAGATGGSGGGAGNGGTGGVGNTPTVSPIQGNPGGNAPWSPAGGGGGGANCNGGSSNPPNGGSGGGGVSNTITGASVARAGGGGGGARPGPNSPGTSGGGNGGNCSQKGTNGTDNTGGGGGSGQGSTPAPAAYGAVGGSGIVVIRYKFQ